MIHIITVLTDRLKNSKLTKQQKKIGEFFLKNQERIGNMSSIDVAKEIGVSDASIIRFSRAIGYEGFADLKNDIYNSLAEENTIPVRDMHLLDRFDMLSGKYKDEDIAGSFLELMNYNITKTFQQNHEEDYSRVADMIIGAEHIYTIGLRGCEGISAHFSRLLGFAKGNIVPLPHNETEAMGRMQDIGPNDMFILFSFARYYKIDMFLTELAAEHKANICVITDSPIAPMVKYADIIFFAETAHISFFNSAIGAEMIGEYIVALVSRKNAEEHKRRIKERDLLTEQFRI